MSYSDYEGYPSGMCLARIGNCIAERVRDEMVPRFGFNGDKLI